MALYNPKDYLLLRWIARPTAPWVPVVAILPLTRHHWTQKKRNQRKKYLHQLGKSAMLYLN